MISVCFLFFKVPLPRGGSYPSLVIPTGAKHRAQSPLERWPRRISTHLLKDIVSMSRLYLLLCKPWATTTTIHPQNLAINSYDCHQGKHQSDSGKFVSLESLVKNRVLWCTFSFPSGSMRFFPGALDGKESACTAGDPVLTSGSGRSPGEGNGNPLQYSCLENSMDRGDLAGYSPWALTIKEHKGIF